MHWYHGVEVNYVSGRKAVLYVYDDEKEVEQVVLSDYEERGKEAMHEMMLEKGFVKRTEEEMRDVGEEIGRVVAAMHDGGLIHGDLTTSNILLRARDQKVVVIDFGLAHNSIIPEDKGVDLYVLERAITVTHRSAAMFEHVMAAYKRHSRQWSASFNKFAEVRMRGRKRSMIG